MTIESGKRFSPTGIKDKDLIHPRHYGLTPKKNDVCDRYIDFGTTMAVSDMYFSLVYSPEQRKLHA